MKQPERECPVCQSNGSYRLLELHQINLTTAVYLCKYKGCTYPGALPFVYVSRNLCDIFDNDSDSESSLEDYDIDISSISSDTDSTISSTCDVSQCSINADIGLDNFSSNIIKENSVKPISSNAQVDLSELEFSASNNGDINTVECPKSLLKLSIKLEESSAASNNSKSNVDVVIGGSNDNRTIDISQSQDVQLQTINISNDTIQSKTCEIKISTPTLNTCAELLDIENIPVVFAESEEGKKLLDSVNQTNVSSPVAATPKRDVNKSLINRSGTSVNKAQHIMKLLKKTSRLISKQNIAKIDKQLVTILPVAASKAVFDYRKNTTEKIKILKRIPAKDVSKAMASSATRFNGFQFKATIIQSADTNGWKAVEAGVENEENISNKADINVENTNTISNMKPANIEAHNESNVEEIALNDFFDNIDEMNATDLTDQLVGNEDVEEWLESLNS